MAVRLNDDDTEKLVLSLGLISAERLTPFRVQASVDCSMLFDLMVEEGVITAELQAELEQKAASAALTAPARPSAIGSTSTGFLRRSVPAPAPSPAPTQSPASETRPLRRPTRTHVFENEPAAKSPGTLSAVPAAQSLAATVKKIPDPAEPPTLPPRSDPAALRMPRGWPGGVAPPDATPDRIQQFLLHARQSGASDVYLSPSSPVTQRVHGELRVVEGQPALSAEQTKGLLRGLLTKEQWDYFEAVGDLCCSYAFASGGRFRASALKQRHGYEMAFRVVADAIPSPEQLGLPEVCVKLTQFTDGLVVIASPAGSGKTTTVFSLADVVNCSRHGHILTLEDPIEYLLPSKSCQVTQREIGNHTLDFNVALHAALLEDPDVIVIGELCDSATTMLALSMAEAGQLVFATVQAMDCARAIDRLMESPDDSAQLRNMLADNLRAILAQQLIPLKEGQGQVAACEVLINSISVANIIREGKAQNLVNVMQTGKQQGMMMLDESLRTLAQEKMITGEEAHSRAKTKAGFKQFLTPAS